MIILDHVYTKEEVLAINDFQNGFVKGVVDVEKGYVALDADMHYQLADYLREKGLPAAWRNEIGYEAEDKVNRKRCGDFGCYLAFINAINAR